LTAEEIVALEELYVPVRQAKLTRSCR